MSITLEFWYLFPIAIMISTIAMSTGIGGAVFFSPLFILALKLDAQIAIGSALITELFGFSSGLIAYYKAKLIDFKLAKSILVYSIPAAIVGTLYGGLVPVVVLKSIFAVGLLFIGYQLFTAWRKEERALHEAANKEEFKENFESELVSRDGKIYRYTVCNRGMGRLFAVIGGAFVGMISVGLAELQEYQLVARCKVPTPVAIATSIFVVVITVLVASIGHFYAFAKEGNEVLGQVMNIVVYTIPGVLIGGQIGPRLQKVIPEDKMKLSISILFVIVGFTMLYTLI